MIRGLITLYIILTIAEAFLSYVPQIKSQQWYKTLKQITDVAQKPIRKILPQDIPVDLSPLIVIFLLNLLKILW